MKRKVFLSDMRELRAMLRFIENFGKERKISDYLLSRIILATEEALVNIIQYGYPDKNHYSSIEISCEDYRLKPGIKIIIKDFGIPFNPIEAAEAAERLSPEEILVEKSEESHGGYGIYIFVGIMDLVEYQRIDGQNQLTLIKYF